MATLQNYDDTAISTGIAVSDIFADLETTMIANRKSLFKYAREQPDFKTAIYSRFEAHNKANSLAAYNALSEAKKLAYEEVTKAHNKGIWLTDKAVEHYRKQGFKGEAKENDFDLPLFMALYAMGNSLAALTTYAINSADKQLLQITGIVNPSAEDIFQEIDLVQDNILKEGIKGAISYNGTEIEMSAKSEFLLRNGTRDALLEAEGQRQADYNLNLIQISSHPSSCHLCIPFQGKVLVNDLFGYGKPDGIHQLVSEAKAAGLFHLNCYDKETEVLTNEGWKLFSELNQNELVYTIDPNTKQPEWQKPINYYRKHHDGDMVYIHNNTNSLMVTPDHNLLYRSNKNKQLRFRPAFEFNTDTLMYAGAEWQGCEPEYIELAGQKVKPELYCKLMAYWLADGSLHGDGAAIKISQQNNEWMLKELEGLPFNVWHDEEKLVIRNGGRLADYFKAFGTCTKKYIPENIKSLSKRLINVFLNAFAMTDGYIHKNASFDGYKSNYNTQLFTTSEQMAADLGELALKAGYRPSYYKKKNKGKQIQFRNGLYTINNDLWTINLNKMVNTGSTVKKEIVHYSDFVYCVEVPKYHTLLVRRKGKVLWCGNCRHTYVVYLKGYSKPDFFERDKRTAKETADIYASEQLQRSNERMIRQWKNVEAGALTEQKRLQAEMKVKEWQARQRILKVLTEKKGLPFYRQYAREQIGGGTRPTLPSFLR